MSAHPTSVQTSLGSSLRLGKQLGKGGEGAVFEVQSRPDLAVKLYWPNKASERREKITAMASAGWHRSNSFVAFPVDTAFGAGGSFAGFVMKRVAGHKPAHLLYSPASRKLEFNSVNFPFLIRAAINTCRAIASVHNTGCVIGDINHSGFLISDKATITLIDSDSFQVPSGQRDFLCKVGTPEYTPPELQKQRFDRVRRSTNHDNFGLAVLIFQLLFMGRHPFSGRFKGTGEMPLERAISEYRFAYSVSGSATNMDPPPNVPLLDDFPKYIGDAFERAFNCDGVRDRPTAERWVSLLAQLETELQPCSAESAHHHVRGRQCPWCRMERATPGFIAFVTGKTISISPTIIDVRQLVAILRGIRDPGPVPDIQSIVVQSSSVAPSSQTNLIASEVRRNRFWWIGGSVVGLALMQFGSYGLLAGASLVGYGAYAIFRGPPKLQDIKNAQRKASAAWQGIVSAWNNQKGAGRSNELRSEANALIARLQHLPDDEKRGLQQLEQKKREAQLLRHLEKFRLADYKIRKIGSGRKATLASYGISTAADIDRRKLSGVPGFGSSLIQQLMSWRRGFEQRFVFKPNEPLNPVDVAALKATIAKNKSDLEAKARASINALQKSVNLEVSQRDVLKRTAQQAYQALKQAEADERVVNGDSRSIARFISGACIVLALISLNQPATKSSGPVVQKKDAPKPAPVDVSSKQPSVMPVNREATLPRNPPIPLPLPPSPRPTPNTITKQDQTPRGKPGQGTIWDGFNDQSIRGVGGPYVPPNIRDVNEPKHPPALPEPIEIPSPKGDSLATNLSDMPVTEVSPMIDLASKSGASRVQQRLIDLGLLEGEADGIWGPRSRQALVEFRQRQGLGVDDKWDDATQRLLLEAVVSAPVSENPRILRPYVGSYVGGWAPAGERCASSAAAPVRLNTNFAETAGGRCDFENIRQVGGGQWSFQAKCSSSGSNWISNVTLTRVGAKLTWQSERGTTIYYGCDN